MKFRSLRKWDDVNNSRALIFFAQMVDELLFEYTLDTYKPSAMNTSLLIMEALQVLRAIESGSIKKPNLKHVIDELCDSLERDYVSEELVKVDVDELKAILKNPKSTESNIYNCLKLLAYQVPLVKYKEANERLLSENMASNSDLSLVRSLTRSYITTLLNSGYSERYIQKKAHEFFHYSGQRVSGPEAILGFIEIFQNSPEEYKVIYKAPKYLEHFSESARRLGITVAGDASEWEEVLKRHNVNVDKTNELLIIAKSNAKEPYTAKQRADSEIEQLQTLIGLYHHKKAPKQISEGFVLYPDENGSKYIKGNFNSMHKCKDLVAPVASKRLEKFIDGFSMERDSFVRFHRCAELHALALGSDSAENQLINLWIALESLVPSNADDGVSQIENISNSIMPFLNLAYIEKLVERLSKDLLIWNERLVKAILKRVSGRGIVERVFRILALDKYSDLNAEFLGAFGDFHLLYERFRYLSTVLKTPSNVVAVLDAHKQRVDWQIRRIYRARNLIVHEGVTPSYTEILIENTHDYLDAIMSTLMGLAAKEWVLNSVDQGFKMVDINYKSYYKKLSEKGATFTDQNLGGMLINTGI